MDTKLLILRPTEPSFNTSSSVDDSEFRFKLGQIVLDDRPHDRRVDPEIAMDDAVAKTSDPFPFNVRV